METATMTAAEMKTAAQEFERSREREKEESTGSVQVQTSATKPALAGANNATNNATTAATSTPQRLRVGVVYDYPADDLLIPDKSSPLFNAARTTSKEGVDKVEATMRMAEGWGSLPPVLVRQTDSGLEVVAGIRRTLAARRIGVAAKIQLLDPKLTISELLGINVAENENRTDTNAVAKAESFTNFIEQYVAEAVAAELDEDRARTQAVKKLSQMVKMDPKTVDEYLQLMNLGKTARTAVIEGTVPRTVVTDRGLKLTRMVDENGKPDNDRQEAALEKYFAKANGKKSTRDEAAKQGKGQAVGYRPSAWEVKQMLANENTPPEAATLIQFLRGELTLQTAKRRMPWLKTAFVPKDGPGSGE